LLPTWPFGKRSDDHDTPGCSEGPRSFSSVIAGRSINPLPTGAPLPPPPPTNSPVASDSPRASPQRRCSSPALSARCAVDGRANAPIAADVEQQRATDQPDALALRQADALVAQHARGRQRSGDRGGRRLGLGIDLRVRRASGQQADGDRQGRQRVNVLQDESG